MCNRLDSIPACDRRTDRQTERRTSCDGIVRAMHTRRTVKIYNHLLGNIQQQAMYVCKYSKEITGLKTV